MKKETYNAIHRLLRRSEKYFKTDMVYLAKGGTWLASAEVVSSASTFLLAIAFANILSQETYGSYKYIMSISSILSAFTLQEIGVSVTQAIARGYEGELIRGVRTKICWGILGSAGSIAFAIYFLLNDNFAFFLSFSLLAACLPFFNGFSLYQTLLQGKKLFSVYSTYGVTEQLSITALLLATLFIKPDLTLLIGAFFLGQTAIRFVLLSRTIKKYRANTETTARVSTYGKHLSLLKGLDTIAGNAKNIFIYSLLGSADLAVFAFALAPIEQMRSFLSSIGTLMFPKLASEQWTLPSVKSFFAKIFPFLLILTLGIILYISLAPLLYSLIFPQYTAAIPLSRIYAPSILFTAVNILLLSILKAKQKTKELYISSGVDIFLNLAFVFLMISYWHLIGLIFALLAIKILESCLLTFLVFKKPLLQDK